MDSSPLTTDGPEQNASEGRPLTRQGRVATVCLMARHTVATLPCLVSGLPSDAFCSGPSGETGGESTLLLFPPASAIVSESETKDARFLSRGCHSSSSRRRGNTRCKDEKTNKMCRVSYAHNGFNSYYHHRGTRLNAMKRFCICSL